MNKKLSLIITTAFIISVLFAVTSCESYDSFATNSNNETSNKKESSSSENSFTPSYSSDSCIFYWKNNLSEYRFGTAVLRDSAPSLSFFTEMQSTNNCSLSKIKEIIKREGNDTDNNKLFEINYPMEIEDVRAFDNMSFPGFPSRNISIYQELGLLQTYNKYYSESKQIYCDHSSYKLEKDKLFYIYTLHFTNLSHIYVWQNADLEYMCGITSEKDYEVAELTPIRYFQEYLPCSLSNMKRIVNAYYEKTKTTCENLVIEIPTIRNINDWREFVKNPYPNNISSNKELYEELGIIESFNSHFNLN